MHPGTKDAAHQKYNSINYSSQSVALHNVYMRDYDSPVSKIALYMLQGNNRISLYIRRILAFYAPNLVVATGEYLRENHEFRV